VAGAQPIPNISAATVSTLLPSSGLRRGVVVFPRGIHASTNVAPPYILDDLTFTSVSAFLLTLAKLLTADGWIVITPPEVGNMYVSTQPNAIQNDIANDPGSGTRLVAEIMLWWDYVVSYITDTYGNIPIVPFGFSWGAYHTITIVKNAPNTIVAYGAHCLPTILANVNSNFLGGATWSGLGHGADILTTHLNGITLPGIVGYGSTDGAVGYNSAGTGGTPVSNTDSLITTAQAANGSSALPTRNTTADGHSVLPGDSGQLLLSTPTATPLSSMGTLTVAFTGSSIGGAVTPNMTTQSGQMAIYASDNLWHTVSFTGSTATTFTGCTYTGTQSATVINGSPICLSGNGPTNSMSYPYWFSTVVDQIPCPRFF
jgi:hypothetical protein